MVDRVINYPGSIPRAADLLNTNRSMMIGLGMLAQEMLGTSTLASGFACTPTSPAGLNVLIAAGRIYSLQQVDPLQYSTLPADTADVIVKQGILLSASTLSCPAPGTSGQSINYLIEAAFVEQDTNPVVLPYYNSANPSQAFSGPSNNGSANYTTRQDTVQLTVRSGTPATTGTQVTPAPDTGSVGLWVVTVAFGQTTITSGNISKYVGAPLLGGSLLQAIQSNAFTYGADTGSANAYAVTYAPAVPALVDGMTLEFQAAFANTAAATFSPNGITAAPIIGGAHAALQGGEIASGSKCVVMWKAGITSWVLLESTGGSVQVSPAVQSQQALQKQQKGFVSSATSGSTVVPPGVTAILLSGGAGGGGGGGGGSGSGGVGGGGGGGGAGQTLVRIPFAVTPGSTISWTIGLGGAGGASVATGAGNSGIAGGNTVISGLVLGTQTLIGGSPGQGGANAAGNTNGGAGGAGFPNGAPGTDASNTSSGGSNGSGGGGGIGGSCPFGGGGPGARGATNGGLSGSPGAGNSAGGGGGCGPYANAGGTGGAGGNASGGFVLIEF
jgi:hypothetical protein